MYAILLDKIEYFFLLLIMFDIRKQIPALAVIPNDNLLIGRTTRLINKHMNYYSDLLADEEKVEENENLFNEIGGVIVSTMSDVKDAVTTSIETKLSKMQETLNKIDKLFDKPKKKGNIAENMIFGELSAVFKNVKDVSAIPHSGDIWIDDLVLIDIKNYSSTVPSTEIAKIKENILGCKSIYCGVLVSISSGISKHSMLDVEKIGDCKYLIYAPQPECLTLIIQSALAIARMASSQESDDIKSVLELIKIEINGLNKEYDNVNNIVSSLINFVDNYYNRIVAIQKYLASLEK